MAQALAHFLTPPRFQPALDPDFRPAVLAHRAFQQAVHEAGGGESVTLALEQADGSVYHHRTRILPAQHPQAAANLPFVERLVKFLLWSRGGFRVYVAGPPSLAADLDWHYRQTVTGRFDAEIMGQRIYERPFEVVATDTTSLPPERAVTRPLGRHLNGCRIGFDLGGSDRKAAAVIDGKVVFSEEVVWDPVPQRDPQYHFDGIMDSLRRAAQHLPRVDAIGGSAAGVYVNNRVKVASLFRGVPPDLFQSRVKDLFLEIRRAWNNIPLEVVNDGEVTALAGSMALERNAVLGIAMGTSMAGGYVTPAGNITTWLNEVAFMPVDYAPDAPVDEWSKDRGCGVQYFSQQAVARLLPRAGIETPAGMPFPERLKLLQSLMAQGDPRAVPVYQTIGTYLGYALAHYAAFYTIENVLVLGRVTSGAGGDLIIRGAQEVLQAEFPDLARRLAFHVPGETEKRHGQAIAAASLPVVEGHAGHTPPSGR
ncbi:ROK family protein [Fontisphaera persica]|uniref:ROK family protein n=1 Tax=Fontisphaera persica TaxID=2974023 RepID=UPI0024BF5915|nr:ROK family protein [Fontisphaera persica]WCJ59539.1 ROK family protein [Fontisphaera persica]